MIKKHYLYNKIKDGLCGEEKLFDFYRKNNLIHHVTSKEQALKIISLGKIKYNDGSFKDTFPQSKICYARYRKCISLFNIVTPTVDELIEVIDIWVNFISRIKPAIFINFKIKKISDRLISNKTFRDDAVKFKKTRMGYIEDIYPASLDISLATSFLILDNKAFTEYSNSDKEVKKFKNILSFKL